MPNFEGPIGNGPYSEVGEHCKLVSIYSGPAADCSNLTDMHP